MVRRKRYAASSAAASWRPTYPPTASASRAASVVGLRSAESERPCTNWRSCTANSTSRSPPGPSFSSRSTWAAGMASTTRRRICCTSGTKFSRSAACQTSGATASWYASPSAVSPATGRALSSAWNSQVFAQRLR